jgi:2-polyprenyl-3-methyl-5-hydroxy-6-metoxy-1,4-benzoquinol methylase
MPLEEDIGKAYQNYYTHDNKFVKTSILGHLLRKMYHAVKTIPSQIIGLRAEEVQIASMYLTKVSPGKLLDVGCGSGEFLNDMQTLGWEVEGVDFDSKAVQQAHIKYGIKVHLSNLENVGYPDNSFDAITMSHVIEHITDPIALLKECYRILKPGAYLVVTTPNINSWGHQKLGMNWRGLEPPRHLHLFSPSTLRECAEKAGFQKIDSLSTTADTMLWFWVSFYLETFNVYTSSSKINLFLVIKTFIFYYYEFLMNKKCHNLMGGNAVLLSIKTK